MNDKNRLTRQISLVDVFCIASGAMISSGLFILPGLAFSKTGPSLFLSYLLAGFLTLPAMFSKAELTTAMPKAGGDYFFITRSMGYAVGTIAGAASWFSLSLKSAFALLGMSMYLSLFTNIPMVGIGVFLCLFFTVLNIAGIREASIFQRILVFGLLGALAFYIIYGFSSININRYVPFAPYGAGPVFATAGFVFISFGGLTKIASIAEEVKNPGRNLPLGMIFSIVIVSLFYALVVFITTGLLEPEVFKSSLTPISDGAGVFSGGFGKLIMSIAAVLAFVSTANAGIMSASRYPVAMSRDKVLPRFFQSTSARFKSPHYSIVFTGTFMVLAILFLDLESLVKVASTFLILLFMFANIAVVIMRESKIQNYQPKFRSPLYPWMQISGVIISLFLIYKMGAVSYKATAAFFAAGVIWYLVYVRTQVKKEFALIHVIARITAKELTSGHLETELKEILRERDNIVEDRFDKLINSCTILDLERSVTMNEFFRKSSEVLSKELSADADNIYNLLIERENESSTVIRQGLAIPHIIVGVEHKFCILLARCKEGIVFPGADSKVHVVFMLIGSKDERNLHLRALAAIAAIAQGRDFDKKWLNARNIQELRHIILLAERKRFGEKKLSF
ncbi:MAG: amino acid permease [Candidatus Omnitrophota bacterium]